MNIKDSYDCVIVGAGPAGAMCAYRLAKGGLNVLLVERQEFPRNKACTGMLSTESIEIIEKEFGGFPGILKCYPYEYKGVKYTFSKVMPSISNEVKDSERCYSIRRAYFDYWLAVEASKAGADVADNCALAAVTGYDDKSVTLKLLKRNQSNGRREYTTVASRYVVAADGMDSILRRFFFPERSTMKRSFVRQEYYTGDCDLDPEYYHFLVNNGATKSPIWFFRKGKYLVLGFMAYPANELKTRRKEIIDYMKETYNMRISEHALSEVCSQSLDYTISKIRSGKLDYLYFAKDAPVLFVGEAAEMSDVMNCGINVAMYSSCRAAEAILRHWNDSEINAGESYKESMEPYIQRMMDRWNRFNKSYGRFF